MTAYHRELLLHTVGVLVGVGLSLVVESAFWLGVSLGCLIVIGLTVWQQHRTGAL